MARGRVTIGRRRPGETIGDPNHMVVVSTKALWSDTRWIIRPWVYPISATFAVAPAIPIANLEYAYGVMRRPGYAIAATYQPLDLLDHYVRIQVFASVPDPDTPGCQEPLGVWHGIIVQEDRLPDAAASSDAKLGRQRFVAYGLEHLLRKCPVDTSVVYGEDLILRKNRVELVFNQSVLSGRRMNNRSDILGESMPTFWPKGTLDEWDLPGMAQYLLTWFANQRLAMEFKLGTVPEGLTSIKPVYAPFNKSVFTCLTELFTAERGLGWNLEVAEWRGPEDDPEADPQPDLVELHVHTSLTEAVTVGDLTIPANPLKLVRLMDSEVRIPAGVFRITQTTVPRYKTVRLEGAPIVVMFSASYRDGSLEADWSAADTTAYAAGASGAGGYSGLGFPDQAALNDEYRSKRAPLNTVYLRHRIARTWNWRAGRYPDGAAAPVVPFADANGNIDWGHAPGVTPLRCQKRLLDWLPLRRGVDYTASPPVAGDGLEDEYERPLIFCDVTRNGRDWNLAEIRDLPADYPRVAARVMTGEMGFELRPSGAAPHRFGLLLGDSAAGTWFDPNAAEPTLQPPRKSDSIDYRAIVATVAAELEVRPYVEFSPAVWVDNDETLIITLPWIEYWAATAQAMIGRTESAYESLVHPTYVHPAERVLRDDTPKLRAIAACARQWHSTERRLVDVTIRRLEHFPVGALLQAVSYGNRLQQVNTVVTGLTWDFTARTTRVTTSHREIDLAGLFGGQPLRLAPPPPSLGHMQTIPQMRRLNPGRWG